MSKWILLIALVIALSLIPKEATSATDFQAQAQYEQWGREEKLRLETEYNAWLEDQKSKELTDKAQKLVGKHGGQCLIFARNFTGIWIQGYAGNVKAIDVEPEVGGIYKSRGHVGVVLKDNGETLTIVDSNYKYDERIRIREIPKTIVLGYIN